MGSALVTQFGFRSEGATLAGNLFVPEREPPVGVVIAVGPLTAVKEQAAGAYARAMAERGFATLAFDYRYFGESGGLPRQFENPEANITDIRSAATALCADPRLTHLSLAGLGVCFGAGPMARAVADDERFHAFAGVAGVYTDIAKTKAAGPAYRDAVERGRVAERLWLETGDAETIPAVAADGGDVAMPLREAYEYYGTPRGQVPNYVNAYAVQSLAYTVPFDAVGAAPLINVPVLLVHSEHALAPDLAHAFYAAVRSPKRELWLTSDGQIDFYDDPNLIGHAADAVAALVRGDIGPTTQPAQRNRPADYPERRDMASAIEFNQTIIDEFRATGGRPGGSFEGAAMLLLHATGARSGAERINPLMYVESSNGYAVFASNSGRDANPGWFYNLRVHPEATIEIGTAIRRVHARLADDDERDRLWERQKELRPDFAHYQDSTSRTIPALILQPIADDQ